MNNPSSPHIRCTLCAEHIKAKVLEDNLIAAPTALIHCMSCAERINKAMFPSIQAKQALREIETHLACHLEGYHKSELKPMIAKLAALL